MLRQVVLRSWRRLRELYEGYDFLAALRSFNRASNDCRTHYRGVGVQYGLNFGRVDILSKPNDQFFGSAHDEKISVFEAGKITSVEPTVWIDRRGRSFRGAIVTFLWRWGRVPNLNGRELFGLARQHLGGLVTDEFIRSDFVTAWR
jgi:hypothetical protein